MEKSKNPSKNRIFEFLDLKYGFLFSRVYFQAITAGISVICWKTKNLGRFYVKNDRFGLNLGNFVQKSKNRSKNRVFDFFRLKIEFFSRKPVFTSHAIYKILIPPKTKKLRRFWKKNPPPPAQFLPVVVGPQFWKFAITFFFFWGINFL